MVASPRLKWFGLALLGAVQFMVVLDIAIVNVALPSIQTDLDFSQANLQWVISAYALVFGGFLLLGGRTADLLGRRRIFMLGLIAFTIGSLLCGLAWSETSLIGARAIQGLGAGGIIPVTFTILGDQFSVAERAKIAGLFSAVWGSSAVAGPTLGGLIVEVVDWRWVFYINLPFGAACVYLMWRYLHEERRPTPGRIDYAGAALLTTSITAFMFALLAVGEGAGWLQWQTGGLVVLSLALLGLFLRQERRFPNPMIPLDLFSSRLIAIQDLKPGECVGYGADFECQRPMRIGVVACGYADGYPRHAPTGTPILVGGARTRTVGRVSMDMIAVDLSPVPGAKVGTPVVLWGDGLPVDEVAMAAGTVGYELLCAVAPRVPMVEAE